MSKKFQKIKKIEQNWKKFEIFWSINLRVMKLDAAAASAAASAKPEVVYEASPLR